MADLPTIPPTPPPALPDAGEGLVADRMSFWSAFTSTTVRAAVVVVVVLILLAVFVV